MRYFIRIITIITFIAIPAFLRSQSKIDISIKDHNDSVYYLLKYKSDKSYIVIDTSNVSYKKKTFENNKKYVLISTCGFYTAEKNYDSVLSMFNHICGKNNFETKAITIPIQAKASQD